MFSYKRADDTSTVPLPAVAVTPAEGFSGNDGLWSTFLINVGDGLGEGRGQDFRVLISTSSSITQIPSEAPWCTQPDKAACAADRGVELFKSRQSLGFQERESPSWQRSGNFELPVLSYAEDYPEKHPNGTYGTDAIGLGQSSLQSPVLLKQTLALISTQNYFMGSFGLGVRKIRYDGGDVDTFLHNFWYANRTKSRSYGYTAGASYKNRGKGVVGNLVLGGYDHSRFNDEGVSLHMPTATNDSLVVGVQSIDYTPDSNADSNSFSLIGNVKGFMATIDSTLPYLWLPRAVCDEFEKAFRLQFDEDTKLYTVNDAAHRYNLQQNALVSFKIGQYPDSNREYTSIELPYAAFDLEASFPLVANKTKYFPIKRSPNGEFVLGRTFLQESYLIVDYDRANFTVAPANFSDPMPPSRISAVLPGNYVSPKPRPSGGSGLAPGAIAGIAVGVVIGVLLVLLAAFMLWKHRRQPRQVDTILKPTEIDPTLVDRNEMKHYPGYTPDFHSPLASELESNGPTSPRMSDAGFYVDNDRKDVVAYPPIKEVNEMESPDAPVIAELESPAPESGPFASTMSRGTHDEVLGYFDDRLKRRGATRESSGQSTPAVHDERQAENISRPAHSRTASDVTAVTTTLDAIVADPAPQPSSSSRESSETMPEELQPVPESPEQASDGRSPATPVHTRGPSDVTVQSAVSEPTPEEVEEWTRRQGEPRRPLSE